MLIWHRTLQAILSPCVKRRCLIINLRTLFAIISVIWHGPARAKDDHVLRFNAPFMREVRTGKPIKEGEVYLQPCEHADAQVQYLLCPYIPIQEMSLHPYSRPLVNKEHAYDLQNGSMHWYDNFPSNILPSPF